MTISRTCDRTGTGDYDLLRMSADQRQSDYVFSAEYSGDPSGHDVLIRFALAGSAYAVDAELFEDGTGVAQLQDPGLVRSTFLTTGQVVSAGRVEVVVTDDLIARISGQPFDIVVKLSVDGSPVESC
jgi:hypothetical protein